MIVTGKPAFGRVVNLSTGATGLTGELISHPNPLQSRVFRGCDLPETRFHRTWFKSCNAKFLRGIFEVPECDVFFALDRQVIERMLNLINSDKKDATLVF